MIALRNLSILFFLTSFTMGPALHAEINASSSEAATPWTSLVPLDHPDDFYFAVVTDRTGGHRKGVFPAAMEKLNLIDPAFVVSVGDLIEGYTDDANKLRQEWDEMEGFVGKLNAPFFYTPGNHDMSNSLMSEAWRKRFGPSYYHFTYKDVLFLSLNSELFGMVEDPDVPVPGPWAQEEQMDYTRKILQRYHDAKWTIILIHQPLWDPAPNRSINPDWLIIEKLLSDREYTVFAGHYHQYTYQRRNDRSYVTLSTTGGGSPLRGPLWGEFDHVALVKMTQDGPLIANLLLDGIQDKHVATRASRDTLESLQRAIRIKPVVDDADVFRRAPFLVEISNPTPNPLAVTPTTISTPQYRVEGLAPKTINPGVTKKFELEMIADEPVSYRTLQTTSIQWQLSTTLEDGQPVDVEIVSPARPLTTSRIPVRDSTISVDGLLNDWPKLSFQAMYQGDVASSTTNPADVSFRFDLQDDADGLHIAVSVTDDEIVSGPQLLARLQDSVAIMVDTRPAADRNINMPVVPAIIEGVYGGAVVQIIAPNGSATDTFIPALEHWTRQVDSAVAQTSNGYDVELRIPHSVLDALAGEKWTEARIGIRAYDLDSDESTPTALFWQPYRFGSAPLPLSGMFTRGD